MENKIWTVTIEEDENGEAILPFPQELLDANGWAEGDELEWFDNGDGSWTLEKIDKMVEKNVANEK